MDSEDLIEEELTRSIIGAFYKVYRTLGFGFLQHVYILALERELRARGHRVARELSVDIMYAGEDLCTQRLDMVVDDKVVVETKSTYALHPRPIASHGPAARHRANTLRAPPLREQPRVVLECRLDHRVEHVDRAAPALDLLLECGARADLTAEVA